MHLKREKKNIQIFKEVQFFIQPVKVHYSHWSVSLPMAWLDRNLTSRLKKVTSNFEVILYINLFS